MSARDKSDVGDGKILPEELDADRPAEAGPEVHPERHWQTGPDLAAAEAGAHADDAAPSGEHAPVESGAHFRESADDVAEPVELDHPPRHGA